MTILLGGRYSLEAQLARGASGIVWRAVDLTNQEPLAVKTLPAELADLPQWGASLRAESQLLASFDHPGVVRVRAGAPTDGVPALLMALAVGGDLRRDLTSFGPLPPALVALVGARAAEALAYVHGQGIVHGDIKPANLLLGVPLDRNAVLPGTDAPQIWLADFGVARRAGQPGGPVHATPEYAATEVASGAPPEPPSDVYSLGVALYELACGQTPFRGGDPAAVLARHSMGHAVQPPGMPDELWAAIAGCLLKTPEARPTPTMVTAALDVAAMTLQGVPASPPLPQDAVTWMADPAPVSPAPVSPAPADEAPTDPALHFGGPIRSGNLPQSPWSTPGFGADTYHVPGAVPGPPPVMTGQPQIRQAQISQSVPSRPAAGRSKSVRTLVVVACVLILVVAGAGAWLGFRGPEPGTPGNRPTTVSSGVPQAEGSGVPSADSAPQSSAAPSVDVSNSTAPGENPSSGQTDPTGQATTPASGDDGTADPSSGLPGIGQPMPGQPGVPG